MCGSLGGRGGPYDEKPPVRRETADGGLFVAWDYFFLPWFLTASMAAAAAAGSR